MKETTVSLAQAVTAQEAVLPARVQEALGELVGAAREGLLALSVGVGLGVLAELMEEEVVEVRRRTKVIGRFPGETSALSLIWAVLELSSRGWRGVVMTPKAVAEIERLRRALAGKASDPSTEEVIAA